MLHPVIALQMVLGCCSCRYFLIASQWYGGIVPCLPGAALMPTPTSSPFGSFALPAGTLGLCGAYLWYACKLDDYPGQICIRMTGDLGTGSVRKCCVLSCRYFGAAKQLPGVKELFEKDAPRQVCLSTTLLFLHKLSFCRLAVMLDRSSVWPPATSIHHGSF